MTVHAHPDDEASKGSGTIAKYAHRGARAVLVTCTGGEAGDVINPAVADQVAERGMAAVREEELEKSCRALGYESLHMLGYHDSGMPGTDVNERPDNFANADLNEATERLVRIIRAERPQVLVTYSDRHDFYPHPDHIKTHEVSVAAVAAAADPDRYPDSGEPHTVAKVFYVEFSIQMILLLHQAFIDRGEESPFAPFLERVPGLLELAVEGIEGPPANGLTTRVDVGRFLAERRGSLQAHRSQIPDDSFFLTVPDELVAEVYPFEDYSRASSDVDVTIDELGWETDLFSGLDGLVWEPPGGIAALSEFLAPADGGALGQGDPDEASDELAGRHS
jgi:mycothiol S-conjugate amidase